MADGITRVAVEGFKSIVNRQEIEIGPLTILAGANSSGKSSIMQPLLLLKQTLEATYDPGPLKIDGPNVRFTSSEQFLSKGRAPGLAASLTVEIELPGAAFRVTFQRGGAGLEVVEQRTVLQKQERIIRPGMSPREIAERMHQPELAGLSGLRVAPSRFFLGLTSTEMPWASGADWFVPLLRSTIHVPSLRGNPSRTYPRITRIDPIFPGTFLDYFASVILHWQSEKSDQVQALDRDLDDIGLTEKVMAKALNEIEIDLQVSRIADSADMISIADVGFGVSQVLPVLVALHAADAGRLVYLEEPEIHLHPRAQTKLADVLADAAKRGVRVVAETHSSLVLRAVQTLVAKGDLPPELVRLHWFSRDREGVTRINPATLDANGAFGDWPEDFGDVALESEKEYLDAVEDRLTH
jgi:hypothetical protein